MVVGVDTEGDKFDAGVTGREVLFFQDRLDMILAKTGLSGAALGSELSKELLSPSAAVSFLLKLRARRKPAVDELPRILGD